MGTKSAPQNARTKLTVTESLMSVAQGPTNITIRTILRTSMYRENMKYHSVCFHGARPFHFQHND
jgi:hypothetical protein